MQGYRATFQNVVVTALPTKGDISRYVQHKIERRINQVGSNRDALVALSGGSQPDILFGQKNGADWRQTEWDHIHWLEVDERLDPEFETISYEVIRQKMMDLGLSTDKFTTLRLDGGNHMETVRDYDARLNACIEESANQAIDIVLLGMGGDGHTASWFPGKELNYDYAMNGLYAFAQSSESYPRATLTPKAVSSARQVLIIATGAEKQAVLNQAITGGPGACPVQMAFARKSGLPPTEFVLDYAAVGLNTLAGEESERFERVEDLTRAPI